MVISVCVSGFNFQVAFHLYLYTITGTFVCVRALAAQGPRSLGPREPWKSNRALVKFYLRAQWTPKIGEFVIYFIEGSSKICLEPFEIHILWAM